LIHPIGQLDGGNLHSPVRFMCSQYRSDNVIDWQVTVARADFRQSLTWAEAATSATANMVGTKERTLSARISLNKLTHGRVWIDCRRQAHNDQPYIISVEKQKTGGESGSCLKGFFAPHEIGG
jgi:hypothetical protein